MKSYLLINNSFKKSYKISGRLLSKYLPQVGPSSFCGSLSQEGVQDLERELQNNRSRYMSVACYELAPNHETRLSFIVGNKSDFDTSLGLYSFRSKTTSNTAFVLGDVFQYFTKIAQLAGFWHDLGKGNLAFQNDILGSIADPKFKGSQFLRHDAVGFLILYDSFFRNNYCFKTSLSSREISFSISDLGSKLISPDAVKNFFNTALDDVCGYLTNWNQSPDGYQKSPFYTYPKNRDLFDPNCLSAKLFLFLVLTHHRLPSTDSMSISKNECTKPSYVPYLNETQTPSIKDCFTYKNLSFISKIEEAQASCISAILDKYPSIVNHLKTSPLSLFRYFHHYVRPLLIFSDHLTSAQKQNVPADLGPIANTLEKFHINTGSVTRERGDYLETHLINVGRTTRKTMSLISKVIESVDRSNFPFVNGIQVKSLGQTAPKTSPFYWQDNAAETLKAIANKGQHFVCVSAATGSGKTLASAKILNALNTEMRYTYALGLTSLTLQTGLSYMQDLGMTKETCAVVLGNQSAANHFNAVNQDAVQNKFSESLEENDLTVFGGADTSADWLALIENKQSHINAKDALGASAYQIINTPIIVCTIDQIIENANLSTLKKASLHLRIATSDLVIDEVDNYGSEDIKHVGRLIYLFALAGRNVVIMSATVSREIVQGLFANFHLGLKDRALLIQNEVPCYFTQISNNWNAVSEKIPFSNSISVMNQAIDKYNSNCIKVLESKKCKSKVEKLDISQDASLQSIFNSVLNSCKELHSREKIKVKNAYISIGFVRFNHVKNVRQFTRYLHENIDNTPNLKIVTLCYHSKMSSIDLGIRDDILRLIANKKKLAKNCSFSKEGLSFIENIIEDDTSEVIFVIVASPIIEVGRDLDFDWCVLEPCSPKSAIQSVGRVYRHRPVTETRSNVVILSDRLISKKTGTPIPHGLDSIFNDNRNPGIFSELPGRLEILFKNLKWKSYLNNSVEFCGKLNFDTAQGVPSDLIVNKIWEKEGISSLEYLHTDASKVTHGRVWEALDYKSAFFTYSVDPTFVQNKISGLGEVSLLELGWIDHKQYYPYKFRHKKDNAVDIGFRFINAKGLTYTNNSLTESLVGMPELVNAGMGDTGVPIDSGFKPDNSKSLVQLWSKFIKINNLKIQDSHPFALYINIYLSAMTPTQLEQLSTYFLKRYENDVYCYHIELGFNNKMTISLKD